MMHPCGHAKSAVLLYVMPRLNDASEHSHASEGILLLAQPVDERT